MCRVKIFRLARIEICKKRVTSVPNATEISHNSCLEAADQSQISGCLVASEHCLPTAADERWHSLRRPYSTVAVNSLSVLQK